MSTPETNVSTEREREAPVEILPCPFCGSEPEVREPAFKGLAFKIACSGDCNDDDVDMGAIWRNGDTFEEAAARWNRRAPTAVSASSVSGDVKYLIERIIRDVCEIPDRNSPDDDPDMLLVRYDELKGILEDALEGVVYPSAAHSPVSQSATGGVSLQAAVYGGIATKDQLIDIAEELEKPSATEHGDGLDKCPRCKAAKILRNLFHAGDFFGGTHPN